MTPNIGRSTTRRSSLKITPPGGEDLTLDAEPDGREAGTYAATYISRSTGPYRVLATASAPDGAAVGQREAGWAAQPAADEFARLQPDREWLESIAARTKGEVVDGDRLASFVSSLSSRDAPIDGTMDLAVVAPAPLFPHRDRLPGRRMGPAAGQRPGVSRQLRTAARPSNLES